MRIFALALRYKADIKQFGALVQLVRIHACHAWGHGFESRTHRKKPFSSLRGFFALQSRKKKVMARWQTHFFFQKKQPNKHSLQIKICLFDKTYPNKQIQNRLIFPFLFE